MADEWILDVLADLKTFATRNDLSALAVQLDRAAAVARFEITSRENRALALVGVYASQPRTLPREFAVGDDS
ncbi:hypothetical protein [Oceaniglobus roseus]|uniref:hypothetical protein n=1 Tax=Oceaniglobus roseus TaxID=1737570 RepID=UPI000C7EB709|nr:hypothetical protein [Kandeliimicrobium roseum]